MENQDELNKILESLGPWHHIIDFGNGIKTPANPLAAYDPEVRWRLIEKHIPQDLSGMSVLDLGCNSGYFSVKMKQRGASRVVSVDVRNRSIEQTQFLSKWHNVNLEIVKEDVHVYCLTNDEQFDFVIFFGLFYHLKYGTIVLDRLVEMTKKKMFFQTSTLGSKVENYLPQENYAKEEKHTKIDNLDFPRMMFIETKLNNDRTNWWLLNENAIISLLRNAGFKIIEHPQKEVFICEPSKRRGKKIYNKLIFPRYGKDDSLIFP